MQLENTVLTEVNQARKDTVLPHMWIPALAIKFCIYI